MTISLVGIAAQGVGTNTAAAAYDAGLAKDEIALFLTAKPYTIADPTHVSYDDAGSLLASITDGTVASAADAGSVKLVVRRRDQPVPTTASTNTITVTGGDTAQARTVRVTTDQAAFTAVNGWGFADTAETGTGVSATTTVAAGAIAANDFLVFGVSYGDDAPNHTTPSVTIAGCTVGTITWVKAQTTTGNDVASYIGTGTVTAGSSTGAVTYAATSSVSGKSSAAVAMVRYRDTAPAPGQGTVTGSFAYTGAVVGKRSPKATVTGALAYVGSIIGKRAPKATASGTFAYTGTATGVRNPKGTAGGTWAYTGSVSGVAPAVGVASGYVEGFITWVGDIIGHAPAVTPPPVDPEPVPSEPEGQVLYLFVPPTVYERIVSNHPLFGRMSLHRGTSLIKSNGLYRQVRNPSDVEISMADVTYIGGHNYVVDELEASLLRNAGYGDWLTEITEPPPGYTPPQGGPGNPTPVEGEGAYGAGAYGDGPYGG